MRRLLLLLIGLLALGTLTPTAPASAAPSHHRTHATTPAAPCHDGQPGGAAVHACLGCALQPDTMPPLASLYPGMSMRTTAAPANPLIDHRTGFDPPPPRAAV